MSAVQLLLFPPARPLKTFSLFLLQSSLRISPPLPFLSLTGGGPRDSLKMGVGSRMDQEQAALAAAAAAAVTPSPTSASKRWPGASVWPSWDLLEAPKDPFSIEREARLHRQAAGECGWAGLGPTGPDRRGPGCSEGPGSAARSVLWSEC